MSRQCIRPGTGKPPVIARQSDCQTCFLCEIYCPTDALYVAPCAEGPTGINEAQIEAVGLFGSYSRALGWRRGKPGRIRQGPDVPDTRDAAIADTSERRIRPPCFLPARDRQAGARTIARHPASAPTSALSRRQSACAEGTATKRAYNYRNEFRTLSHIHRRLHPPGGTLGQRRARDADAGSRTPARAGTPRRTGLLSAAQPHPQYYQQHLLHCDPLERFSVVSFVWGPGQKTPVHDHTVVRA